MNKAEELKKVRELLSNYIKSKYGDSAQTEINEAIPASTGWWYVKARVKTLLVSMPLYLKVNANTGEITDDDR